MFRRLLILGLLAAVAAPAAVQARPLLHARVVVSDTKPVVVRGSGFHPRERVYVKLFVSKSYARRVTATARGTFSVQFSAASIGRCASYGVSAVGNRGSRASFKIAPMCAPTGDDLMPTDLVPKKRP